MSKISTNSIKCSNYRMEIRCSLVRVLRDIYEFNIVTVQSSPRYKTCSVQQCVILCVHKRDDKSLCQVRASTSWSVWREYLWRRLQSESAEMESHVANQSGRCENCVCCSCATRRPQHQRRQLLLMIGIYLYNLYSIYIMNGASRPRLDPRPR